MDWERLWASIAGDNPGLLVGSPPAKMPTTDRQPFRGISERQLNPQAAEDLDRQRRAAQERRFGVPRSVQRERRQRRLRRASEGELRDQPWTTDVMEELRRRRRAVAAARLAQGTPEDPTAGFERESTRGNWTRRSDSIDDPRVSVGRGRGLTDTQRLKLQIRELERRTGR